MHILCIWLLDWVIARMIRMMDVTWCFTTDADYTQEKSNRMTLCLLYIQQEGVMLVDVTSLWVEACDADAQTPDSIFRDDKEEGSLCEM